MEILFFLNLYIIQRRIQQNLWIVDGTETIEIEIESKDVLFNGKDNFPKKSFCVYSISKQWTLVFVLVDKNWSSFQSVDKRSVVNKGVFDQTECSFHTRANKSWFAVCLYDDVILGFGETFLRGTAVRLITNGSSYYLEEN